MLINSDNILKPGVALQEDEKYKIIGCLGQGGFGITYSAFFKGLDKRVAIKEFFLLNYCSRNGTEVIPYDQILPHFENLKESFRKEAKILAKTPHPNIPNVTDVFEENGTVYFVMEFIEGKSLKSIIEKKGPLPEDIALNYIKQISFALKEVHSNALVHRDVKPDNILITSEEKAILIDFGAARDISQGEISITGILTHGYAPPEQYQQKYEPQPNMDIYSLGATLYHCVTGRRPAESRNRFFTEIEHPIDINPKLSPEIDALIWKAMDLNPLQRFQTILEFAYEWNFPPKIFAPISTQNIILTKEAEDCVEALKLFCGDKDHNAFVIVGSESSEKYIAINRLIEKLETEGRPHSLLAPIGRVANGLQIAQDKEVKNLYPSIYNFELDNSFDSKNSWTSKLIPLRENHLSPNHIFIIFEAQLLTDNYLESSQIKFGSGKLLFDFLKFITSGNKPSQKIILAGDNYQLLRGSKKDQAINPNHLEETYGYNVKFCELPSISKSDNSIISNYNQLSNCVQNGLFNNLSLDLNGKMLIKLKKENFWETYSKKNTPDTIFITFSNQQATDTNQYIRKKLGFQKDIQIGDWIIMHNSIPYLTGLNFTGFIPNGEIGKVVETFPDVLKIKQKVQEQLIDLELCLVKLFFPRLGCTIKRYFHLDFLNSGEKEIDSKVFQAIIIYEKSNRNPNGNTHSISDNDNDYLFNIALIKYAYAQTCHRAQGLFWKTVFINCDTGNSQENEAYFRWLYTGISRGREFVFLLNPPEISPFKRIVFNSTHASLDNSNTPKHWFPIIDHPVQAETQIESLLSNFNIFKNEIQKWNLAIYLSSLIQSLNWTIKIILHKKNQEEYTFTTAEGELLRIQFWYDGNEHFTKIQCITPESPNWHILKNTILAQSNRQNYLTKRIPKDVLQSLLLNKIKKLLAGTEISITQIRSSQHNEEYTFETKEGFCICNFFSNDQGFFTSVTATKYSSKELLKSIENHINILSQEQNIGQ